MSVEYAVKYIEKKTAAHLHLLLTPNMLSREQTNFAPQFLLMVQAGREDSLFSGLLGFTARRLMFTANQEQLYLYLCRRGAASGAAEPDGGQEAESVDSIESVGLSCKV